MAEPTIPNYSQFQKKVTGGRALGSFTEDELVARMEKHYNVDSSSPWLHDLIDQMAKKHTQKRAEYIAKIPEHRRPNDKPLNIPKPVTKRIRSKFDEPEKMQEPKQEVRENRPPTPEMVQRQQQMAQGHGAANADDEQMELLKKVGSFVLGLAIGYVVYKGVGYLFSRAQGGEVFVNPPTAPLPEGMTPELLAQFQQFKQLQQLQ